MKASLHVLIILMILFLLATGTIFAFSSPGVPPDETSPYSGMVSTSHPVASQVGADILEQGGNAIDAAVAVQFALNVVEPNMSGIGGGGFIMIYLADEEKVVVIDCREEAPAGATSNLFQDMGFWEAVASGKSIGIPGTLDGLETAVTKYGTRSLGELIEPSIKLAEDGVIVNSYLASAIWGARGKFNDAAREVFWPDGERLVEGDLLVQENLAKTFRLIRDQGTEVFYGHDQLRKLSNSNASDIAISNAFNRFGEPEVGAAIAATAIEFDGIMDVKDLPTYRSVMRDPVWGNYRGYDVASMPSPSSGGMTMIQMLKILEGFDVAAFGQNSADTVHLMAETMRLAYADRALYMGDGDFVAMPLEGLLNDDYIEKRRALIDMDITNPDVTAGDAWAYDNEKGQPYWWRQPGQDWQPNIYKEDTNTMGVYVQPEEGSGETTHFTTRDKWGNLVSYTSTIEMSFGSGKMVPEYGFMLNNELTDFDFTPGGPNEVAPGKRPRSSMTPTIVLKDGEPVFSVGSPGGMRIITTVMQVLMNMVDHGMPVQDAINAKRMHSHSYRNIELERGFPNFFDVRADLWARGHSVSTRGVLGSVQSIAICSETGQVFGGADDRREGTVIGIE